MYFRLVGARGSRLGVPMSGFKGRCPDRGSFGSYSQPGFCANRSLSAACARLPARVAQLSPTRR
jgi:hypothetical protein